MFPHRHNRSNNLHNLMIAPLPVVESQPHIVHSDEAILVVDKPAGWPAVSLKGGIERTLAAWLIDQFPSQASIGARPGEAGLVHRLDNDTSGLLVAARTEEVYRRLRQQFDEGTVEKEYAALVLGHPPAAGVIDLPIAHHPRKKKKMVVCESKARAEEWKARPARTEYRVIERFAFPSPWPSPLPPQELRRASRGEGGGRGGVAAIDYSLLTVTITTGVRHQIRAHLASMGHPIAGDRLYQNPKMRAADALPLARHFLHAVRIAFVHPERGTDVAYDSPLPDDLKAALAALQH